LVPEGLAANDAGDVGGCCPPEEGLGVRLYNLAERTSLPDAAVLASPGCGNPTVVAELREGETVLDLGSGGGIDVLLSAKRVGPTGKAFGLDMTDDMLELARDNARKAGATNVEFLKGYIEDVPLESGSVDVVISNCVINLSTDKPRVVPRDVQGPSKRRGSYVGCIAGALSFSEYGEELTKAGFVDASVEPTHLEAD
jgi:SAM-dependent methyltransferase